MKTCLNFTAYILLLLHLYSCNGDVFIDDFRTSDTELILDGNGDVGVIRFTSSNWELIGVYMYDNDFSYPCRIYDTDNNLVATEQVPFLKGMGKIVCDEQRTGFRIERRNPEELKITVEKNTRSKYFRFILMAGNDYDYQEIYVAISPSGTLQSKIPAACYRTQDTLR